MYMNSIICQMDCILYLWLNTDENNSLFDNNQPEVYTI